MVCLNPEVSEIVCTQQQLLHWQYCYSAPGSTVLPGARFLIWVQSRQSLPVTLSVMDFLVSETHDASIQPPA